MTEVLTTLDIIVGMGSQKGISDFMSFKQIDFLLKGLLKMMQDFGQAVTVIGHIQKQQADRVYPMISALCQMINQLLNDCEGQAHMKLTEDGLLETITEVFANTLKLSTSCDYRLDAIYNLIETLSTLAQHPFMTDFVISQPALLESVFQLALMPSPNMGT